MQKNKPAKKNIEWAGNPIKTTGKRDNFLSYSLKQKRIRFNDTAEEYSLGDLLIEFLDLNFEEYEKRWQEVIANLKCNIPDNQSYVIEWILSEMEELKTLHPYFRIIDEDVFKGVHYEKLLNDFDLLKIQELFISVIKFCLCTGELDEFQNLNTMQRYYIYHLTNNSPFETLEITTKTIYEPIVANRKIARSGEGLSKSDLLLLVENEENLILTEYYYIDNIITPLYIEFIKMVECNMRVTVCERCNRFFMPYGLRLARYCNRIIKGDEDNTCRTLSTSENYKEKLAADPSYRIYRTTCKYLNVRKNKGLITDEEYKELTTKTSSLREAVNSGQIALIDYENEMNKIKTY